MPYFLLIFFYGRLHLKLLLCSSRCNCSGVPYVQVAIPLAESVPQDGPAMGYSLLRGESTMGLQPQHALPTGYSPFRSALLAAQSAFRSVPAPVLPP